MIVKIKNTYRKIGQWVGTALYSPSKKQGQLMLFLMGIGLLTVGLSTMASAQGTLTITYNDNRIANSVNAILTYIEGSFGALVMVAAGIGAILSAAFGQYSAALGLLVVSVGAFILRSVLATFFNDNSLRA
ncbi:hypothetical protein OAO01_05280 [Oligoflexia bacterium]|nr:hypothetical protein [Oligoflexia bacterium]